MDRRGQENHADEKPTFAEIWSRNERRLWLYCLKSAREGAEDAFGQAAYSAFLNYSACKANSEAWLMRVTKNACTDYHRRRQRARTDQLPIDGEVADAALPAAVVHHDPERAAIGRERAAIVIHTLAAMPEHLRNPLLLTAVDGMKYPDVARRLGIREDALRKRISEGRKLLRRNLEHPPRRRDLEARDWEEMLRGLRERIPDDERQSIPAPAALTPVVITTDAGIEADHVITTGEVVPSASPVALARAERYTELYPRTRSGLLLLARLQRTLGQYASAAVRYEELLARNPRMIVAGAELAEVQCALGRNEDAARTWERVGAHARPRDHALAAALAARAAGDPETAISRLVAWTEASPEDAAAWHFLGEAALAAGHLALAAKALERATADGTADSFALTRLADVRMAEGRPFAAQALLRRALDLDFANVAALGRFARMQIDGRSADAAELVHDLVRLAPEQAETAVCSALHLLASGNAISARAALDHYLERHPRHARAWLEAALLCERTGAWEEARRNVDRALALDFRDAVLRRDAVFLLARLGDEKANVVARALAERYAVEQPRFAVPWLRHGRVLAEEGNLAEAIVVLQKGWALLPDDGVSVDACEGALALSECFNAAGSRDRSIEMARVAGQFAHALESLAPAAGLAYGALAAERCRLPERAVRLAHGALHARVAYPLRGRVERVLERHARS